MVVDAVFSGWEKFFYCVIASTPVVLDELVRLLKEQILLADWAYFAHQLVVEFLSGVAANQRWLHRWAGPFLALSCAEGWHSVFCRDTLQWVALQVIIRLKVNNLKHFSRGEVDRLINFLMLQILQIGSFTPSLSFRVFNDRFRNLTVACFMGYDLKEMRMLSIVWLSLGCLKTHLRSKTTLFSSSKVALDDFVA